MKKLTPILIAIFLAILTPSLMFAGVRPDINDFSSSQRTILKNMILDYAGQNNNAAVVEHTTDASFAHSYDENFLIWHRQYIAGLETYLGNNGGSQFVPLPSWNPNNCIPNEFFNNAVLPNMGSLSRQCPAISSNYDFSRFIPADFCNNYAGMASQSFCNRSRTSPIDKFAADLQCEHNPVHGAIGGAMGFVNTAPGAAIFWLWHAWVDDVYLDYQDCLSPTSCTLGTSTSSMSFLPGVGNNITGFSVTSNGNWTVSNNSTWISLHTISGTGNEGVTFTISPNTTTSLRTSTITITCGSTTRTVTITQAGVISVCKLLVDLSPILSPSQATIEFIQIYAGQSWIASTNVPWITLMSTSGNGAGFIDFSLSTNTASTSRTGTITISGCGATKTVTITQEGANSSSCSLSTNTYQVNAVSGSSTRSVNIYSASGWTATDNVSWITLNSNSGYGNGTLSFCIAANPYSYTRYGTITITCGYTTITVTVSQCGASSCSLSTSVNSVSSTSYGGYKSFYVYSSSSWTASDNAHWITSVTSSGNGNGLLCFNLSTNYSTYSRSGTITISCGGTTRTVSVYQAGAYTSNDPLCKICDEDPIAPTDPMDPFNEVPKTSDPKDTDKLQTRTTAMTNQAIGAQLGNYPNPFKNATTIEYTLEEDAEVTMSIRSITGTLIANPIVGEPQIKGTHNVEFQADGLPAGLYFYTLQIGNQRLTKQMAILR